MTRWLHQPLRFVSQMDDFSFPDILSQFDLPPSPRNFPRPGKRPMSSMSPTILTDQDGAARLVIGDLSQRLPFFPRPYFD